jgi:hypothetical protein
MSVSSRNSEVKSRLSEEVPRYASKETQTVRINDEESVGPGERQDKRSQLYFYRYLTAQRYEDIEKCTYLRQRDAGKRDEMRVNKGDKEREGSLAGNPQKIFIFRPPTLKQPRPGGLRRQQSKNLHSALNR